MTLEQLLDAVSTLDYRLVSLSDMSVVAQPRWWATLHSADLIKFGEGSTPYEALGLALASTPRPLRIKYDARPSQIDDLMNLVGLTQTGKHEYETTTLRVRLS